MVTLERLQEFNIDDETIKIYLEPVELFMNANSIKGERKVAVLLSVVNSRMYSMLCSEMCLHQKSL
jgi:hypothetical protein